MSRSSNENMIEISIRVLRETEKALCFDTGEVDDDGAPKHCWVSKSKATSLGGDRYELPEWIAKKEGIDCFAV